mmetsp:Transcript_9037/g.26992  ORF Transcript_9037/g.26992 Transcript_9037/m.26992 type:complete len:214 (+) Transcript_9037:162-803(+)
MRQRDAPSPRTRRVRFRRQDDGDGGDGEGRRDRDRDGPEPGGAGDNVRRTGRRQDREIGLRRGIPPVREARAAQGPRPSPGRRVVVVGEGRAGPLRVRPARGGEVPLQGILDGGVPEADRQAPDESPGGVRVEGSRVEVAEASPSRGRDGEGRRHQDAGVPVRVDTGGAVEPGDRGRGQLRLFGRREEHGGVLVQHQGQILRSVQTLLLLSSG